MGKLFEALRVWSVWRDITRALAMRGMLREMFLAPSVWRMFGVDFVSGLRRNASTQKVIDILAPLEAQELRQVHAMAQLNHRRHEAVSRWFAVGMITLPVSAALAVNEIAPDLLAQFKDEHRRRSLIVMIVYALVVVGFYLMAAWRARQVATVVELALIERGVLPEAETVELAVEPSLET